MKLNSLSSIFQSLGQAARRCVARFPVTVAFTILFAAYQLYLITGDVPDDAERLVTVLGYYLSVGMLLSLALHLWAEEVRRPRLRMAVQAVAHLLFAADAVFLYLCFDQGSSIELIVAHVAGILALGVAVFFVSFFREKDDIPACNFAQYAVVGLILAYAVGMVMSGGLCLLLFSVQQLFGLRVGEDLYMYILVLFGETLPLLLLLGILPQGERKHDARPHSAAFLNGVIRYLFLPLAALYLAVLYLYAARILVRWELPDGWVSWLVTVLMAGCVAIEFGLYPVRVKEGRRSDERIARWLPLLALPLLLLMTVGIGRRFMDYGITINRLYLAALNVWFYLVCIGLVAGRARRISWIPISFAAIFLLTSVLPVNFTSITHRTLHAEVRQALAQSGQTRLPLTEKQYDAWITSQPKAQAEQVNEKLRYLDDLFGPESIRDLVDDGISFYSYRFDEDTVAVREDDAIYYNVGDYTLPLPQGYRYMSFAYGSAPMDSLMRVPLHGLHMPTDTLCLPLDTLLSRDRDGSLPPPVLKTRRGNTFVLTSAERSYKFYEEADSAGVSQVYQEVEGLLFHNTKTEQ